MGVKRDALGILAAYALDKLWVDDQQEGCCVKCCAPCEVLGRLSDEGKLDNVLRGYAGGSAWWRNERVDQQFLHRAWRYTALCPYHLAVDPAQRQREIVKEIRPPDDLLKVYRGMWVATRGHAIIFAGASARTVLDQHFANLHVPLDAMFEVPLDI